MTDFKAIFGKKIKLQTSDLTMSTATEGELFYSDTDGEFKVGVTVVAWASGGNMNTARKELQGNAGGGGLQTAAIAFGGSVPAKIATTEEYDGTDWTATGNYPVAITQAGGFGTQTAQVGFGGEAAPGLSAVTAEYNGSTWTAGENLPTANKGNSGAGILTAGLAIGGNTGSAVVTTLEYDGTDWAAGGDLNTAKGGAASAGPQTAALITTSTTETYDGTSWTEIADMNTGRGAVVGAGGGTDAQTNFVVGGGGPSPAVHTEHFDGTSWAEVADMATARGDGGGNGTGDAAVAFAGEPGSGVTAATEEYTATVTLKTVTDS